MKRSARPARPRPRRRAARRRAQQHDRQQHRRRQRSDRQDQPERRRADGAQRRRGDRRADPQRHRLEQYHHRQRRDGQRSDRQDIGLGRGRAVAQRHRRQRGDRPQRRRSRTHPCQHERRGRPQHRRPGRRDHRDGIAAGRRDVAAARREVERAAGDDFRQGPGVRRRSQPHHRPGGEVDRGQELRLHPDDDGQQRGDRAAHQRREPNRHRRHDAHARAAAGRRARRQRGGQGDITRTLDDLHAATRSAIEESKQTASATVADMLETHGMLRSDTTALFERLREANILLQEVLQRRPREHELARAHHGDARFRVRLRHERPDAQERHQRQCGAAACRHVQRRHRESAARARRTGLAVQRPWTLAGRGGRASGKEQPPHRGIGHHQARQYRGAGVDARHADRRFCPAPAPASPACSTSRSTRRRRGRGRSPASSPSPATPACKPSNSNTSWCARPRKKNASTPARRSARSTTKRPGKCTACSASRPSVSPRSCKA